MPKNSPVVLIVGHGSSSGKGALVDYSNYHLLLAVKEGYMFDVISYNLLLGSLISSLDEVSLNRALTVLEALPTTVVIDHHHQRVLPIQAGIDLAEASQRGVLLKEINKTTMLARNSQSSWELLEHKITAAQEIFTHPDVLKLQSRQCYEVFQVMSTEFANASQQGTIGITFTIALDTEHIKNQVKAVHAADQQKTVAVTLAAQHILHLTPHVINSPDNPQILLSEILKSLSEIHIIARIVTSAAQEEVHLHNIIFEEFKQNPDYIANFTATDNPDTYWIDFTIPDDSNIILGACREIDQSF